MPNKQLTKHSWKPQMQAIPIRFTKTDMQALKILRDCLGTPDTTRTVRAALGTAVAMVQSLMNQQGFTDSAQFQAWWREQQARAAAAETERSVPDAPMAGSTTGPVVEAHGPGDGTDAYQPTYGDDTADAAPTADAGHPDVAGGAPVP